MKVWVYIYFMQVYMFMKSKWLIQYELYFIGEEVEERVTLANLSSSMTAELLVSISFTWSSPVISLQAELCATEYITCLHSVPVLLNYELKETSCESGTWQLTAWKTICSQTAQCTFKQTFANGYKSWSELYANQKKRETAHKREIITRIELHFWL